MDWKTILPPLIGAGTGALLSGLISFCVALVVLYRTRNNTRLLAREQAGLAGARELLGAMFGLAEYLGREISSEWRDGLRTAWEQYMRAATINGASIPDSDLYRLLADVDESLGKAVPGMTELNDEECESVRSAALTALGSLITQVERWHKRGTFHTFENIAANLRSALEESRAPHG
ncbi:hypothetical protein [Fodinicola acaciae]|uniref:hypothetical protein n=1 Tax=Fodinicola acaciae TaxID=2681555 RepID=UPI0013D1FAB4|nr:hypothetical protein [Fodinicola acaciae]